MFKTMGLFSLLIVLVAAWMSGGIWQKSHLAAEKSAVVRKDMDRIQQQLDEVTHLAVRPLPAVQASYQQVYESFRRLGDVWGIKYDFDIQGKHGRGQVIDALKASRFYGIGRLNAKASFFQIQDEDQYEQIFKTLSDLEHSLPLEITTVQVSGQSLEVDMQIYG